MEVTGVVQKQAWLDKVMPPVEQVRPGLWSIPVPIPDNPLRYVLIYALEGPKGVTLVDAGWDVPEAWAALQTGLETAGHSIADVRGVLVTHMHPDHYGLAGRVREASGAWVALHPEDVKLVARRYREPATLLEAIERQMAEHGVPSGAAQEMSSGMASVFKPVEHTLPEVMLEDGALAPVDGWELRTVWTPGHSPGHVCFHETRNDVLLSGDHVLPRITPSIGVHPVAGGDPLGDFFDSLEKVGKLPVGEVLPAHEYRFSGIGDRVADLLEHHRERLDEIIAALRARPEQLPTAWDLAQDLTWSKPWADIPVYMRRGAMSETLAHLVLLERDGRVTRSGGGDGPVRWEPAGR